MTGEDRRAAYLHHDADALAGFPRGIRRGEIAAGAPTSDGESSPVLADLNGDNRNELIVASSDGFVHALEPNGDELPGWPVRGDVPGFVAHHSTARAYSSGEVSTNEGGAIVASVAVGDANGDGVPGGLRGRPRGQGLRLARRRPSGIRRGGQPRLLRQAADALRQLPPRRDEPHPARLPRLAGARRPQRRRQAGDHRRRHGPPRLRLERRRLERRGLPGPRRRPVQGAVRRPGHRPGHLQARLRDLHAGRHRRHARRGRPRRRRQAGHRGRHERGVRGQPGRRLERRPRQHRLVQPARPAGAGDRCLQERLRLALRLHPRRAAEDGELARLRHPLRRQRPRRRRQRVPSGLAREGRDRRRRAAAGRRRGRHRLSGDRRLELQRRPGRAEDRRHRQQRRRLRLRDRRLVLLRQVGRPGHPDPDRFLGQPDPGRPPAGARGRPPGLRRTSTARASA